MTTSSDTTAPRAELAAIEAPLLALLETLEVAYAIHRHPPIFTVAESQAICSDLPGAHVKNMFLKDKKGGLWLVTCLEDRRIKIRSLEKSLGAQKMSFAKPELMTEAIGVAPGAVTPLAVINIRDAGGVVAVLDQAILEADVVNCHPLHNEATIALSAVDLMKVYDAAGAPPRLVDFDALEAAAQG